MIAVILCARMESSRFPGKVLSTYCSDGKTNNLQQIARRWYFHLRGVPAKLVVATTTNKADNAIDDVCYESGIPCYRGSVENVVERMHEALMKHAPQAEYVVRALADNPLVDVPQALQRYRALRDTGAECVWYGGEDYKLTYCATTDVWPRQTWERIVKQSTTPADQEHPGLWVFANIHECDALVLELPEPLYCAPFRTELDTPDDLAMFQALWQTWHTSLPERPTPAHLLGANTALRLLQSHPEIARLNQHVPDKTRTLAAPLGPKKC